MRTALLLLVALAMASCRPQLTLERSVEQRDSVVVQYMPRDSVVWTVRDSVRVHAPTDKPKTVTKKKGRATTTLHVSEGQATATCVCDSAAIKVRLWDKWTKQSSSKKEVEQRTKTITRTPKWAWWALLVAVVSTFLVIRKPLLMIMRAWPA